MTCRLLSLSSEAMWPELLRLLENRDNPDQTVETDVRAMLDAVRKGGDSAVLEYVRRFDCPDMRPKIRAYIASQAMKGVAPCRWASASMAELTLCGTEKERVCPLKLCTSGRGKSGRTSRLGRSSRCFFHQSLSCRACGPSMPARCHRAKRA